MSSKKLLIDATHSEETRVAVVDDAHLEEFDYENKVRKQLKGNIFLAKVTRVEPSLQAAFVDYGGNRHGFLPFSEIHPDYFRIPVEDRQALQAELAEEAEKLRAAEDAEDEDADTDVKEENENENDTSSEDDDDNVGNRKEASEEDEQDNKKNGKGHNNRRGRYGRGRNNKGGSDKNNRRGKSANSKLVEVVGGEDDGEFVARPNLRKKYKIQEVIKRGQVMLIQVSKEERGNKGAAVTTYLSLAGRYCVLMPNSPRAGGVSRKVPFKDRKKLKSILSDLNVSDGMSVILRTAGVDRNKAEIKRDYDYLTRLWEKIREQTLQSSAPALIHEEANLIKRTIRDLYTRDIEEVLVAGKEGHKEAKEFMKLMIPSHSKKVKLYEDERIPLFHRYQIESQIAAIGDPTVTMKSGGSLVINPTEALVSIDVNSGRATKERHIEETALRTNLEAADEVARQLRLRDLGGLVVIDFIDMEDNRNNRKVQNRMREALSNDRARVQVGHISNFGLMELSRQRLNPSLTEAQFQQCPHCQGVGVVRTMESTTLNLIRELEEEGIRDRAKEVRVEVPNDVALYILNNKRHAFADIEDRYGFTVLIHVNEEVLAGQFKLDPVKDGGSEEEDKRPETRDDNRQDNRQDNRKGRSQDKSSSTSANTSANTSEGKSEDETDNRDNRRGNRGGGGRKRGGRGSNENAQKDRQTDQINDQKSGQQAQTADKESDQSGFGQKETDKPKKTGGRKKAADSKKLDDTNKEPEAESKASSTSKEDEAKDTDKPKKRGGAVKKKPEEAKTGEKQDDKAAKPKKSDDSQTSANGRDKDEEPKAKEENKGDNKAANSDTPEKSHPDENVTVIPDAAPSKKKKAGRKGWWNRILE